MRGKHRKMRLEQVFSRENLVNAVNKSRKGKERNKGVKLYDKNANENLAKLQESLMNETFEGSKGHDCMRKCPCGKTRKLYKLPYYPDHIAHHALMQVLMSTFLKALYKESGASVNGRGIMYTKKRTERWIDEHKSNGRIYYVKLDFVKFYENIDQDSIYKELCRFFSNKGIRRLLKVIVYALPKGLGIGLYPIQTLANFYMSILCRKVCERYNVKVEIYCDDVVVLGIDKKTVWNAVNFIKDYAANTMKQPLHDNYGMQIIDEKHFLDFVGFRFYFSHTLLRKKLKERFKKKMHNIKDPMLKYRSAMSYKGWMMHCNGFNLWKQIMNMEDFSSFKIPQIENRDSDGKRIFKGQRVSPGTLVGRKLIFHDVEFDVNSPQNKSGKTNVVSVEDNGTYYKYMTNNPEMVATLKWLMDNNKFPFTGTIANEGSGRFASYKITGTN